MVTKQNEVSVPTVIVSLSRNRMKSVYLPPLSSLSRNRMKSVYLPPLSWLSWNRMEPLPSSSLQLNSTFFIFCIANKFKYEYLMLPSLQRRRRSHLCQRFWTILPIGKPLNDIYYVDFELTRGISFTSHSSLTLQSATDLQYPQSSI